MSKLPLFPLNLVILPYEYLPLHIFEPRYKVMIKNSIEKDIPFGIIHGQEQDLYPNGCRVLVSKVYKKYETGEYDVLVKGNERFQVFDTNLKGETVIGEVEYIPILKDNNRKGIDLLQDSYLQVLLKFGISSDLEMHIKKKISYEFLQGFQLPLQIKKELILMDSESKRLEYIHDIFNNLLNSKAKLNISKFPEA